MSCPARPGPSQSWPEEKQDQEEEDQNELDERLACDSLGLSLAGDLKFKRCHNTKARPEFQENGRPSR